ncbi:hypothetical protein OIO90_003559 [Microbotryomycetes sp. JL221]|nr:hypothetical protein OIO90_003559 [Microbotryomycetes sp. JL221]
MGFATARPYEPEPLTRTDLIIACVGFGWFCGFVHWVIWDAIRQTRASKFGVYIVLVWGEILVCVVFAIICWLYLLEVFPNSFAFFFSILTCWALQVQLLLQIIINRINVLMADRKRQLWLKWGVAALITLINISVYCIWIPARLQINDEYVHINEWWDRTEKTIYLVVDLCLNLLFIKTVNDRLISQGLERYRPLLRFNTRLIVVSIAMDGLIIGMMSLPNSFCYMQMHSVSYIVKLAIEMALSDLIVKIATARRDPMFMGYRSNALEIAVHTKVQTESQAVILNDLENGLESKGGSGTTRTPARPDLHLRLAKMREDRRAKLARQNEGDFDDYVPQSAFEMTDLDEKEATKIMVDDESAKSTRGSDKKGFDP